MKSLLIPCPECGKELRLRDRKLLGRKGRCPKCGNNFVLEEPEEVELELAETAAPAVPQSAQWVPDSAPAAPVVPSLEAAPVFQATEPVVAIQTEPAPAAGGGGELGSLDAVAHSSGGVARLQEIRRKNAKRRNVALIAGTITAVAVAGIVYAVQSQVGDEIEKSPQITEARVAEKEQIRSNAELIDLFDPISGKDEPIDLMHVPFGARVIFHIRPAELWAPGNARMEELRYSFGPLVTWAEAKLKEICRREPAQIEEAIICVLPKQKGEPVEFSAVVHLTEEQKKSEMILEFQGRPTDEFGYPVYIAEDYAYLLKDLKTFAVAPADRAEEIAHQYANPQTDGIDELIYKTDRRRHLTVLFEPRDIRTHDKMLVPEVALPILNLFLDYFSDVEIDTVGWSFHFGEEELHSEMLMRNTTVITAANLQRSMKKKFDSLPDQLVSAIEKMEPVQLGHRKLIGRFPVFMKAFAMTTLPGSMGNDRFAQLVTLLPERAAPNLVASGMLAWAQSLETDFSKEKVPTKGPSGPQLPDLIVDRLKMNIDIEFSRTPLQEAFAYIAEESKVNIEIDGDALKLSGYTKNMPQSFALGSAPGIEGIKNIVKQYDKMCIIVDEQKKLVTVMTIPVATDRGLTPFPLQ